MLKKCLCIALIVLVSACSLSSKSVNYKQIHQTNVSLSQAQAQCSYERQLSREADARAGVENGLLRQVLQEKSGYNLHIEQLCLRRFGWDVEEFDMDALRKNYLMRKAQENTQLQNGTFKCDISKNIKNGLVNEWTLEISWPKANVNVEGMRIPFEFASYGEVDVETTSKSAFVNFTTPNKDTLMKVYYDGKIFMQLQGEYVEATCNSIKSKS